jgi:hypothetical protein
MKAKSALMLRLLAGAPTPSGGEYALTSRGQRSATEAPPRGPPARRERFSSWTTSSDSLAVRMKRPAPFACSSALALTLRNLQLRDLSRSLHPDWLSRVLQGTGYEVTIAHDGAVAARTIMRRAFDVIIDDVDLPRRTGSPS